MNSIQKIHFLLTAGASDSRTSSNSSLNRIGSHDIGKPDSMMHLDQKTANPILDSPVSTSSSQSNLSYDSTSQVRICIRLKIAQTRILVLIF